MQGKETRSLIDSHDVLRAPMRTWRNRFASTAATFGIVFTIAIAQNAFAQCRTSETESNNTDSTANTNVCSGTPITGSLSSSSDLDWYRLDVTGAGTISISLSHGSGVDFDWFLYPARGSYVAYASTKNNPETGGYNVTAAGTYYVRVKSYSGSGSYTLNINGPIAGAGGGGGGGGSAWPCTLPSGVNLGRIGSSTDVTRTTSGGFVLMGGGSDVDAAIQWMIGKSGGGDVVVIRSSGTNAYNSYINGLGTVNSVQTLLIDNATEGDNACVGETIRRAEMVFIAGGDQQNYVDYFKGRAVGSALNYLINTKRVPIGGTSAGMMIQSQFYHPGGAPNDTTVLNNPTAVAIGNNFLSNALLNNAVTDTHFSQRNRQARLMSFMASTIYNYSVTWQNVRGIACDEATAYALDANGSGKVFGSNYCFFAKATGAPETLQPNTALTWNLNQQALNVYRIQGTATGTGTFNMSSFTGTGGTTQFWSSNRGTFTIR
jgi:cyanophycinase